MINKPICPSCGSDNIGFPGICTYRWSRGQWRVIKRTVTMNECGDCFHCGSCGEVLDGPFEPPFEFTVQPQEWRALRDPI